MAYAQFARTFLLPLVASRYLGWPLSASLQKRDGYEPADLYPFLPTLRRWNWPLRSMVTLPDLLENRKSMTTSALEGRPWGEKGVSTKGASDDQVKDRPRFGRQYWSLFTHCSRPQCKSRGMGFRCLGMSSQLGIAHAEKLPIQVVVADVARPTPAMGWRNAESLSLLDRASAQFDCVLMLGLLHLLLSDQIPLSEVARLTRDLTREWLIIEWVPRSDPRFIEILRGRDALYGFLNEEVFLNAFLNHFSCVLRESLTNGRILFLLKAR